MLQKKKYRELNGVNYNLEFYWVRIPNIVCLKSQLVKTTSLNLATTWMLPSLFFDVSFWLGDSSQAGWLRSLHKS